MALQPKNGISVSPESGTKGTQPITFSATTNYGRNQRSAQFTFTTTASGYTGQQATKIVTVNQSGHVEYVELDTGSDTGTGNIEAIPENPTVVIQGYSNSKFLSVTFPSGNDGLTGFVKKFSTNGGSTWSDFTDGNDLTGDPGATNRYMWKVQFTVADNTEITSKTWTIKVSPKTNGKQEATYTLTQAAGLPYLNVSKNSITLDYQGTPDATETLSTNSPWSVS